jgi:EpsI family protein
MVLRHQIILSIVLIAQAAVFYLAPKTEVIAATRPLALLPTRVQDWQATAEYPIDAETQSVLQADDTINRTYSGPRGAVNFFVAYFTTQRTGKTPHSPKHCMPGTGWEPVRSGFTTISMPGQADGIHVNHYVLVKGQQRNVVLYWYQSNGRVIASEYQAKIYTVVDSIRKRRSDTALVRVIVNVPLSGDEKSALQTATEFVQAIFPAVKAHLPA